MAMLKDKVLHILDTDAPDGIEALIHEYRRVFPVLVRIAYDKETLAGARAIRMTGLIARRLVGTDPAFLRETCRKLLWSLSDESGGIGWSAPDILGEIVSADPGRFTDIIPLIAAVYDVEEDVFRPGVLSALARVAGTAPQLVLPHAEIVLRGLAEKEPLARLAALDVFRSLAALLEPSLRERACRAVKALFGDTAETWVYSDGNFTPVDIGRLARETGSLVCGTK